MTASTSDRLRAAALEKVALPVADRVLGQRMMRRFRHLQAAQWWPLDRVLVARDAALASVVRTAATEVPMYRELYAAAGVDARRVQTPADLVGLPMVGKPELRDGYPARTTRAVRGATYDECTSGSTGEPFCVRQDAEGAGWNRASFLQILAWAGWMIGQPHLQFGITLARQQGRAVKDRLLRCTYASASDLTDADLDGHLRAIREHRIRFVFGYPAAVAELAQRSLACSDRITLDAVVTWGDNLGAGARTVISSAFGCRVLDAYGMSEGMCIATQCPDGDEYHVHSLDVVVEVVDDDDRPVAPGTPGHVVVTRLHAGPSPLIRYRTGDLAVGSSTACACGRGYETLASVIGRSADTIVTPNGNRLVVHYFNGLFERHPDIASFQVAKTHPDRLELRIVARAASAVASADVVRRAVEAHAPGLRVEVHMVDRLPSRAGKRRFVIDETLEVK